MHRIRALTLTSVLLAAAAAAPPKTRAGEPREARASPLGLVIELRSDFGLEKLNEVEFTTGRRVGMRLNEGISGALGVSFLPLAGGRLSTRLTGGYKFQYLRASNGDAWFTGIPLELTEMVYARARSGSAWAARCCSSRSSAGTASSRTDPPLRPFTRRGG